MRWGYTLVLHLYPIFKVYQIISNSWELCLGKYLKELVVDILQILKFKLRAYMLIKPNLPKVMMVCKYELTIMFAPKTPIN